MAPRDGFEPPAKRLTAAFSGEIIILNSYNLIKNISSNILKTVFWVKRRPCSFIIDQLGFGNLMTVGKTVSMGRRLIYLALFFLNRSGRVHFHVLTGVISLLALGRVCILWDRTNKSRLDLGFDQVKTHVGRCLFRHGLPPSVYPVSSLNKSRVKQALNLV